MRDAAGDAEICFDGHPRDGVDDRELAVAPGRFTGIGSGDDPGITDDGCDQVRIEEHRPHRDPVRLFLADVKSRIKGAHGIRGIAAADDQQRSAPQFERTPLLESCDEIGQIEQAAAEFDDVDA